MIYLLRGTLLRIEPANVDAQKYLSRGEVHTAVYDISEVFISSALEMEGKIDPNCFCCFVELYIITKRIMAAM